MEQYNMLIVETEMPGLRIIQTDAYKKLIGNNPGLIHENLGDFYSKTPVHGLSDVVYGALDIEIMGRRLNQNMIVVDASQFNPSNIDAKKDYLIRESDGVRLYDPALHTQDTTNVSLAYGLFGAMFVDSLFSNEKEGSLQKSFEDLEQRLKSFKISMQDE